MISILYSKNKWTMMACNKLVSRSFLLKNDLFFFPGIYYEDEYWSFKLSMFARKMAISHEVCYCYYQNEGSISKHISQKHIEDFLQIIKLCNELTLANTNVYLYSKIKTLCLGFASRLIDFNSSVDYKLYMLNELSNMIDSKVKYSYSINGLKDFLKILVVILPAKIALLYVLLLRKIAKNI